MSLRLLSREELVADLERWIDEGSDSAPFVTLSYAQSLDGSIAARPGERTRISGEESLVLTHRLRGAHRAILVGIGTVEADDPLLTVRLASGANPIRLVLDSNLRTSVESRLVQSIDQAPLWVLTTRNAESRKREELESHGVRVLQTESPSWSSIFSLLAAEGIASVMVEGGARVISSLLQARAFDAAIITLGMQFLGGLSSLAGPLSEAVRLEDPCCAAVGDDLIVAGRLG